MTASAAAPPAAEPRRKRSGRAWLEQTARGPRRSHPPLPAANRRPPADRPVRLPRENHRPVSLRAPAPPRRQAPATGTLTPVEPRSPVAAEASLRAATVILGSRGRQSPARAPDRRRAGSSRRPKRLRHPAKGARGHPTRLPGTPTQSERSPPPRSVPEAIAGGARIGSSRWNPSVPRHERPLPGDRGVGDSQTRAAASTPMSGTAIDRGGGEPHGKRGSLRSRRTARGHDAASTARDAPPSGGQEAESR
jgi:hypothetical protein